MKECNLTHIRIPGPFNGLLSFSDFGGSGSRPWQGLGSGTAEIKKAAGVLVFEAGARLGLLINKQFV